MQCMDIQDGNNGRPTTELPERRDPGIAFPGTKADGDNRPLYTCHKLHLSQSETPDVVPHETDKHSAKCNEPC